jgi:hypothetical protein
VTSYITNVVRLLRCSGHANSLYHICMLTTKTCICCWSSIDAAEAVTMAPIQSYPIAQPPLSLAILAALVPLPWTPGLLDLLEWTARLPDSLVDGLTADGLNGACRIMRCWSLLRLRIDTQTRRACSCSSCAVIDSSFGPSIQGLQNLAPKLVQSFFLWFANWLHSTLC